ncbi:MAG: M48 family metallopeptidase [Phycisphaerales bacterium]|jgi:Zn-dependent protease with chaperone function
MIQILIIAAFVCARLRESVGNPHPLQFGWAYALLPCLLGWLVVQGRARMAVRSMDSRGSLTAARHADTLATFTRILAGISLCFALLLTDWPSLAATPVAGTPLLTDLVAILPLFLMVLGQWSALYPIERRLRDAMLLRQLDSGQPVYPPPTRGQHLWNRTRFEVLLVLAPILLASLWHEGVTRLPAIVGHSALSAHAWELIVAALSWVGLIGVMVLAPVVLRWVWDLVPIGSGPLRDQADAMCRQYRVRVRGPFLWRTHGTLINAAILGVAWPFRYLLFSDAMLDRFSQEQVEAVMAHEVAHVRERHLMWIGITLAAALFTLPWVIEPLLPRGHTSGTTEAWIDITLLLVVGAIFGFVSRRFEWQADAFAVRHLSQRLAPSQPNISIDAARIMAGTLAHVAALNGIPVRRFSFRHGSIALRCRKVMALAGRPVHKLAQDRVSRVIKLGSLLLLSLAIAALFFQATRGSAP